MTNTHQRIKKRLTVPLELLLDYILLLIMLAAQFIAGHGAHLVFLIWNIFLAWVPLDLRYGRFVVAQNGRRG